MKRIAIITGASSGFGKEFALQLDRKLKCIDEYWLISRSEDSLKNVARELIHKTKVISMDLCDEESSHKLVDMVKKEKALVKILVNSAGFGKYSQVAKMKDDDISNMIKTNCIALSLLSKKLIPYMDENSRIINVASVAAFFPQPGFAVYSATKSYVLSFTRALNTELKRKEIYATAVCPGPSNTNFFTIAESDETLAPEFKKLFMAPPEKIVELAIRDSINMEEVSVYGNTMRAFRLATKLIPHGLILKFLG